MSGLLFHARRRRGGFTLVELMVAMTVLLVAILATFATEITSEQLVRQSRDTNLACADLQAAMEKLLLIAPAQIPLAGRYPPGVPIAEFEGLHLANERIVPNFPGYTGGAVPDPLPIVLVMTFDDFRGRQRTLRLASMKTR